MAGGPAFWKRRFGEKLLFDTGQYLWFNAVNNKEAIKLECLYRCNMPRPQVVPDIRDSEKQAINLTPTTENLWGN